MKAIKLIKKAVKWYFDRTANSYVYPTGTLPIIKEQVPMLLKGMSIKTYGGISLIGKAVVLKTTSNRVKAMCQFESDFLLYFKQTDYYVRKI